MGGSSSTQRTQIPDYMSDAGRTATQRANQIYEAGRMPFTGIDVVAINPAEQAAIDQAAMAASAFGMPSAAANPFEGMEMLESGGLRGYSSYPIYIADMQRLKEQRPDQYAALARQSGFDPITGEAIAPPTPVATAPVYSSNNDDGGPSHAEIMAMHYGNKYSSDGSTPNYSSTGSAPTIKPKLRPKYTISDSSGKTVGFTNSSSGTSTVGEAISSAVGKIFGGFGGI